MKKLAYKSLLLIICATLVMVSFAGCSPENAAQTSSGSLSSQISQENSESNAVQEEKPDATMPDDEQLLKLFEQFATPKLEVKRRELEVAELTTAMDGSQTLTMTAKGYGASSVNAEQQLTDELLKVKLTQGKYEREQYYCQEYPVKTALDESVLQLKPRALDSLAGEERRLLEFVYSYDICGGPYFTDPEQLTNTQKYRFFCMMQDMDNRWRGQESALEKSLVNQETGLLDLPVGVVRDYLKTYLGTDKFDPEKANEAMLLQYDATADMLHPQMISGFGGGGRNYGLLSFEEEDGAIKMVVGSYPYEDGKQQDLQGYYAISLRPDKTDGVAFTLLSVVYTELYPAEKTQLVKDWSEDVYADGFDALWGTNALWNEGVFDHMDYGTMMLVASGYPIIVNANSGTIALKRFERSYEQLQDGQRDSFNLWDSLEDREALYKVQINPDASKGVGTVTRVVRSAKKRYIYTEYCLTDIMQTQTAYQLVIEGRESILLSRTELSP